MSEQEPAVQGSTTDRTSTGYVAIQERYLRLLFRQLKRSPDRRQTFVYRGQQSPAQGKLSKKR
jgi:hypothetical protein